RVYQRIQQEEQENRHNIARCRRHENNGSGFIAENSGSPVIGKITAHRERVDSDKNCDPGTKSEGEEDSQSKGKATLGRTPNHLTLSTTSTLSAGSTGSQARLIQSSHQPENYQPTTVKELGSPVWKPRDMVGLGEATTLPRKGKSSSTSSCSDTTARDQRQK
ncbi:hypothetical protein L9F63_005116, partial [Diploptera punctata]